MNTTASQVRDLLIASFGVTPKEMTDDTTFAAMDVDSLALVELSLMIEKEFGIALKEDELTAELTVRDVADLIEDRR